MKYLQFTVFVVFFVAFLSIGDCIKCYQCNSFQSAKCADEFNKDDPPTDCPANVTMCRKIKQEVFYDDDWNTRYIRECAPSGEVDEKCTDRTGTYKIKVRYCQCGESGCNTATNVKLNIVAVLMPLLAVFLIAFKK